MRTAQRVLRVAPGVKPHRSQCVGPSEKDSGSETASGAMLASPGRAPCDARSQRSHRSEPPTPTPVTPEDLQSVLEAAGAVVDARGFVASFGDPAGELEALEHGTALLDESSRGAVRIAGADATDFLHRLLAGDVRGLAVGGAQRNLLLTAKGRVRFLFDLVRVRERELVAFTEPNRAAGLAEALEAYHFAEDVELVDASASSTPLALLGPTARATLQRALRDATLPDALLTAKSGAALLEHDGAPVLLVHHRRHGVDGFLVDAGPERCAALWNALHEAGARPVGHLARDARRIAAGAALCGVDVDESRTPQEARLEDAFSLAKGCYVGQEVVAKIDTYGGLHRRLVVLDVADGELIESGAELHVPGADDARVIGTVTSSTQLPGGGALAIAFVKLEHEAPGTMLVLEPGARAVRVVCFSA